MNLEKLSLLGISFLSAVGLAILMSQQDPYLANQNIKTLFFLSLFFIFLGILGLVLKNIRRGFLAAAEVTAVFLFNRLGVLNWYLVVFLVALFFIFELLASKSQYIGIVKDISKN